MKTIFLITLSFTFILFCFNYQIIIGGYQKYSFNSNDAKLNNAFKALRDKIITYNTQNLELIPIAVYRQVVNGINYKMISVLKDSSNKSVNLVNSIVNINIYSSVPSVINSENLQNNLSLDDTDKSTQIRVELEKELNKRGRNGASLINFVSIQAHPDLFLDDSFYIVNANIDVDGVKSNEYFVLIEETSSIGEGLLIEVTKLTVKSNFKFN